MPVFKVRFSVPESVMELDVDWINADSASDVENVLQNEVACYLSDVAVGSIRINQEDVMEVVDELGIKERHNG
jgi:hypothetical protein